MKITLTDVAITCALGFGKKQVASNAFNADCSGMRIFKDLLPSQEVVFGAEQKKH